MRNLLLAIDPGPVRSAYVSYDLDHRYPTCGDILENEDLLATLDYATASFMAIEMIASYGMPVGKEVFETCVLIGRFVERWKAGPLTRREPAMVYRKDVKMHLCGSPRANDSNIRQALIDRFGPGRDAAIGRKAAPGVLYGFKKDMWAALGVAVTAGDDLRLAA